MTLLALLFCSYYTVLYSALTVHDDGEEELGEV